MGIGRRRVYSNQPSCRDVDVNTEKEQQTMAKNGQISISTRSQRYAIVVEVNCSRAVHGGPYGSVKNARIKYWK